MAQTRKRFLEYQREYRASHRAARGTTRKFCECGNPATVPHPHGAICQRCAALESAQEKRELRRFRHGYKYGGLSEHALTEPSREATVGEICQPLLIFDR